MSRLFLSCLHQHLYSLITWILILPWINPVPQLPFCSSHFLHDFNKISSRHTCYLLGDFFLLKTPEYRRTLGREGALGGQSRQAPHCRGEEAGYRGAQATLTCPNWGRASIRTQTFFLAEKSWESLSPATSLGNCFLFSKMGFAALVRGK